jgi:hypothetical protein
MERLEVDRVELQPAEVDPVEEAQAAGLLAWVRGPGDRAADFPADSDLGQVAQAVVP